MNNTVSRTALWSLVSTEAIAVLTSIHHVYKLGPDFLVMAVILVGLSFFLWWRLVKKPSKRHLWFYGILVAAMIVGFGGQDGLLNHTIQPFLALMRGDSAFQDSMVGFIFYDLTGFLTLVAAVMAGYFGVRLMVELNKKA